ncbi:hypothetical protein [Streptomyces sp. WG5]|uniref:hypothetical protein n=1 Tax=Streptomyces sp. WG5 TaxID=3417648 RepID=UPI003CF79AAC
MSEFDDDLLDFFPEDFVRKVNKPNPRHAWRKEVQEELDDLGDLYGLPEGIQIPGVKS